MNWRVIARPEAEQDVAEAALWYESQQAGLGAEFVEEITRVLDGLEENPFLSSRRHPAKNIRWRYPKRFPYRIVYEIIDAEQTVVIATVLHAARHDRHWRHRI
jgi:mRNA-degrading endonuclease RelE of RelBE toxin-antitoxin system